MGYRILVAEDDGTILLDLRGVLHLLGHHVIGLVSRGDEAVRLAGVERPDVILMDISLAGAMSGIEAAHRIRQTLEIPVVFLTAHSDESTLREAQATAPYGFVLKPYDKDDLRVALEIAFHRHRMDAKLKWSERRFATTLQAIGDAVISTDVRGMADFVNHAAEILTGAVFADVVGQPLTSFLILLDPISRQPLALDHWNGEAILVDALGNEIPVVGSTADISSDGKAASGQVLVLHNISEERRSAVLRESQRVEQIIAEVSESERRRFGQDLHDGLGQLLTGTAFLCRTLEQKLSDKSQPEASDARNIGKLLTEATQSARELALGLLPVPDQPNGLALALERLADRISSQCQIQCSFLDESSLMILDAAHANHLFRIAQEAVNNALKHGEPRRVDICLRSGWLAVTDDGRGIPSKLQRRGSGLDIMQHRAAAIGGSLKVSPGPSGGTSVTCSFPLKV